MQCAVKLRGPKEDRYNLPDEIKEQLEQMLLSLAQGDNACMSRSEPIFPSDVQETIKWLQSRPDAILIHFVPSIFFVFHICFFCNRYYILERNQRSNVYD